MTFVGTQISTLWAGFTKQFPGVAYSQFLATMQYVISKSFHFRFGSHDVFDEEFGIIFEMGREAGYDKARAERS